MVPIEIKSRELDARLYLSLKVINNSLHNEWEIIIGERKEVINHYRKGIDKPYVFLAKGLENNDNYYKMVFRTGGRFVLLDEEGGIFTKYELEKYPRYGYNFKQLKYVDRIFLWGEKEKENWLKRHKDMTEVKGAVTGNPRFDITKKELSEYFRTISSSNTNLNNYILVNMAFGLANAMIDPDKEINHWKGQRGFDSENIVAKWKPNEEYQKKLFPLFIDGIAQLASAYKDQTFVVRPHPVEKEDTYLLSFKSCPNVRVIKSGAVQEWFPKACMLIHNGCTTAIEGFLAGLEPICYAPIIDTEHIQTLTFDISEVVKNTSELIELVGKKLDGKKSHNVEQREKIKSLIKAHIDNTDYLSADKISGVLDELSLDTIYKDDLKENNYMSNLNGLIFGLYRKMLRLMKSDDSIKEEMVARDKIKFPSLMLEEVEARITAFSHIETDMCKFNTRQIGDNLFRISKR